MITEANCWGSNLGIVDLIVQVADWHHDRNLIDGSTDKDQYLKLIQEAGELSDNICKGNDITYAIGDMLVVLINMAERNGLSLRHCLEMAYRDIKHRKGQMVGGVSVKGADALTDNAEAELTDDARDDIYWSLRSLVPARELSNKYSISARRVYAVFDQELLKKIKTTKIQETGDIYFPFLTIRSTNGLLSVGIKTYCRLIDIYGAEGDSCLKGIPNIGKKSRREIANFAERLIKEADLG